MIFIRIALIFLIIYLVVRSFMKLGNNDGPSIKSEDNGNKSNKTGVSKDVGEYIDYEEVD